MNGLDQAYEACRRITKEQAKNFYYAFLTLPSAKRKAIYAAYAFCRLCDDAADENLPLSQKLLVLQQIQHNLDLAYQGRGTSPVFEALAHATATYRIPQEYFQEVIRGVEMDLTVRRYQNFEELRTYCYRVASVVGLICIQVFGYRNPKAKEYGVDLGLAMQLTNILRDVQEDLERDRIYIPQDEMERFGYSEEALKRQQMDAAFHNLMGFQAQRARQYFRSGRRLLLLLSPRSRACPAVLAGVYSRILDRIEDRHFNVFSGRVSLGKGEKLLLTSKLWLQSILPVPRLRLASS